MLEYACYKLNVRPECIQNRVLSAFCAGFRWTGTGWSAAGTASDLAAGAGAAPALRPPRNPRRHCTGCCRLPCPRRLEGRGASLSVCPRAGHTARPGTVLGPLDAHRWHVAGAVLAGRGVGISQPCLSPTGSSGAVLCPAAGSSGTAPRGGGTRSVLHAW